MADGTLIDTNVLLDVVTDDPVWAAWSIVQLDAASLRGRLLINDIVYAELSVRFARIEDLENMVREALLELAPIPRPALFLGAKAFQRYRAAGGPSPHYSREMRDQSQTIDIVHNYANGLFDEVFCNEISSPGVWWPGPISGGPMNYSG